MKINHSIDLEGRIFSIERYAIHDGEGIRTNIFLKGCPMRCLWCANPEGINYECQLLYTKNRCIGCGECVKVCPSGALMIQNDYLLLDRSKCSRCGNCIAQCYAGALEFDSQDIKVSVVMEHILKDTSFYRHSGRGGITLTGGEPLYQSEFAREILRCAKENLIHTTIETCGDYSWGCLESVLPYVDMIFFDLKHADCNKHNEITGKTNERVISNLKRLGNYSVPLIIRVPIIPGLNDSEKNIEKIASIAKSINNLKSIELLPYHQLGLAKYNKLGIEYPLSGITPPSEKQMNYLCSLIQLEGINCYWE